MVMPASFTINPSTSLKHLCIQKMRQADTAPVQFAQPRKTAPIRFRFQQVRFRFTQMQFRFARCVSVGKRNSKDISGWLLMGIAKMQKNRHSKNAESQLTKKIKKDKKDVWHGSLMKSEARHATLVYYPIYNYRRQCAADIVISFRFISSKITK